MMAMVRVVAVHRELAGKHAPPADRIGRRRSVAILRELVVRAWARGMVAVRSWHHKNPLLKECEHRAEFFLARDRKDSRDRPNVRGGQRQYVISVQTCPLLAPIFVGQYRDGGASHSIPRRSMDLVCARFHLEC